MLQWLLENSKAISLKIQRDPGIRRYLPGYHDYLVTASIDKQTFWGRGIDSNENDALFAACSEVVERATLQYYRSQGHILTSNGIAAHTELTKAIESAKAELIERDTFLTHYLTKIPFLETDVPESILETRERLANEGVLLRIGTTTSPQGWTSSIAACTGREANPQFGIFIGAATRRDPQHAIIKSLKEVVAFVLGFSRKTKTPTIDSENSPIYHYVYSSQCMNHSLADELFTSSPNQIGASFKDEQIETEILDLHPAFEGCPVTVVRATSPDAQQLFFGETKPGHINFKRLSQFLGKEVRWDDVNKTTHVFA